MHMTRQADGTWECRTVTHMLIGGWVPISVVMGMFPQTIARSLAVWRAYIVQHASTGDDDDDEADDGVGAGNAGSDDNDDNDDEGDAQ